uniref:Uncharacterized protein n=1 Tax=Romanomermis culicivorax TaxID=13658 RepID=A0A915J862_ROMCU
MSDSNPSNDRMPNKNILPTMSDQKSGVALQKLHLTSVETIIRSSEVMLPILAGGKRPIADDEINQQNNVKDVESKMSKFSSNSPFVAVTHRAKVAQQFEENKIRLSVDDAMTQKLNFTSSQKHSSNNEGDLLKNAQQLPISPMDKELFESNV